MAQEEKEIREDLRGFCNRNCIYSDNGRCDMWDDFAITIQNISKIGDKMITREKAKALLPVIQAYAEGKTIQYLDSEGNWKDYVNPPVFFGEPYRIKPEQKYRPFQTKEECWNEMLRHQPFGWVNDLTENNSFHNIIKIYDENGNVYIETELCVTTLSESFEHYEFIDGTPFGIKED